MVWAPSNGRHCRDGEYNMDNTLFLYIDILGFSDLAMEYHEKICKLFSIIDHVQIHRDSCCKSIVFSDTIIAYNRYVIVTVVVDEVIGFYTIEADK